MKTKKIFIIAEAGVNHNGNIKIAKKLIREASKSGVDAIKFQTFQTSNLATKNAKKAKYQISKLDKDKKQYQMLKELELTKKMHFECIKECKKNNILFMSSAFDIKSFDFLLKLNLKIHKIPSGEITNLPLLKSIGQSRKKIILSTGMSNLAEIKDAIKILLKSGTSKKNITVLHCNTEYPSPFKDLNLKGISFLRDKLKLDIGYSDHSIGIEVPIAVAALGATIIEKHFTLNKKMKGPDHSTSLEPNELKTMVKKIRNIEIAMGKYNKIVSTSEKKNIKIVRKSIYASQQIKKNEIFSYKNLIALRPNYGISPMKFDKIIGKKSKYNFKEGQLIRI
jgi:N,N'-diacetyllegionaminate synthase